MEQTNNNLGHIIRHFLPKILYKKGLSKHQLKVLDAIAKCKTKALGGSVLACQGCGEIPSGGVSLFEKGLGADMTDLLRNRQYDGCKSN